MGEQFNRFESIPRRRYLRRKQTFAEKTLWSQVRGGAINGLRFQRQFGIGPFIIDFYVASIRLAIEIDGELHDAAEAREYDARRTGYLESLGIRVIRFRNEEVTEHCDEVIARIVEVIAELTCEM